jgi:hypothetical protein
VEAEGIVIASWMPTPGGWLLLILGALSLLVAHAWRGR